ncbi:MAG: hypothetical protein JSS81_02325 [Acidobacteria bacterium]|nr:hypothetical protein [Acidobacteriota bacterium]
MLRKILAAAVLPLVLAGAAAAQGKTSNRIAEIRAHLVYEENGLLSRDILKGDFTLWNAIIGEGDSEGHASSTLVFVVVETDGKPRGATPVLRFSAVSEDGKRVKYDKTFAYIFPNEGAGRVFVPFLLHDTGCQKIRLTARLVAYNNPKQIYQTVAKEIPFACGE